MANLSMAKINTIKTLHESGHSNRKIAELLGIDRGSVAKYVGWLQNPPNAPTGNDPHRPGPASAWQPFQETIEAKLAQGLSARRIFRDLRAEYDFDGSYQTTRHR